MSFSILEAYRGHPVSSMNPSGTSFFSEGQSLDGQRLLVLESRFDDSAIREIRVVLNGIDQFKRLAPTDGGGN